MAEHRAKAIEHLQRGLDLVRKNKSANESLEFQFLWHKGNLLLDDLDLLRMASTTERPSTRVIVAKRTEIAAVIDQVRRRTCRPPPTT